MCGEHRAENPCAAIKNNSKCRLPAKQSEPKIKRKSAEKQSRIVYKVLFNRQKIICIEIKVVHNAAYTQRFLRKRKHKLEYRHSLGYEKPPNEQISCHFEFMWETKQKLNIL